MFGQKKWCAAFVLFAFSDASFAVDETSIGDRMSVVGVISESTTKGTEGIAVLKDRRGGRTFAVKTGETVPGEPSFEVTSVKRNAVVVSNGSTQYTLTYFDDFGTSPAVPQAVPDADTEAKAEGVSPSEVATKVIPSERLNEVENGKFYWVGSDAAERKKAQERLERSGIAAGWETNTNADAGFTVTVNNGLDDAAEFEAGEDATSEWYDTNDSAAEIIDRLNSMVDGAPRYEAYDGGVPPQPSIIE